MEQPMPMATDDNKTPTDFQHYRPMFPPTLITVRGKPATQEERDAVTFKPVAITFRWTNEGWALAHLPKVRVASLLLAETPEGLKEKIGGLAKDGVMPALLDGLCETKQHLLDAAKILDTAIARCFLMLERLGYDPEKNPPDDGGDEMPEIGGAA